MLVSFNRSGRSSDKGVIGGSNPSISTAGGRLVSQESHKLYEVGALPIPATMHP